MNAATIVTTYKNEGGTVTLRSVDHTAGQSQNVEPTPIAVGAVDQVISGFNINTTKLQAFGLGCKKTTTVPAQTAGLNASLVVKVLDDDGTTVLGTFTITPQNGIGWSSGDPISLPLTAGVITSLKITNTGTDKAIADFVGRFLFDE
jgi:hypothetical protein